MTTAAQEEFDALVANSAARDTVHPEDRNDPEADDQPDLSEEDSYRASQIDAAMRTTPSLSSGLNLPPASFDAGRSTGVKGVIADARSYENARRTSKWKARADTFRRSVFGMDSVVNGQQTPSPSGSRTESETDEDARTDPDEEAFLEQWREARRKELEAESARSSAGRERRRTPTPRTYGKLDLVDMEGYLEATERVARQTTVVVFVYDHNSDVSAIIESELLPLVSANPTIHFVKVHYEDVELDNAAVPALLAYREQGQLFANLVGVVEMMAEKADDYTLEELLRDYKVL